MPSVINTPLASSSSPHVDPTQLLDKPRLAASMGLSVRLLDDLVSNGRFPKGVRVGRRLYWTPQAVETWRQRTFAHQLHWRP
jgi:predicted DNA-binding transcriptional regulator AlpA